LNAAQANGEGGVATSVEACRCPPGYIGSSCERCQLGYWRLVLLNRKVSATVFQSIKINAHLLKLITINNTLRWKLHRTLFQLLQFFFASTPRPIQIYYNDAVEKCQRPMVRGSTTCTEGLFKRHTSIKKLFFFRKKKNEMMTYFSSWSSKDAKSLFQMPNSKNAMPNAKFVNPALHGPIIINQYLGWQGW